MRKLFVLLSILAFCQAAGAQNLKKEINIADRHIVKVGDSVEIAFRVEPGKKSVRRGRTAVLAPALAGDGYTWSLPLIAIQGRKAAKASRRHDWASSVPEFHADANVIYTAPGATFDYRTVVPWQAWMERSDLTAEGFDFGCCSENRFETMTLAQNLALPPEPAAAGPSAPTSEPVRETTLTTGERLAQTYSFILPASEFAQAAPGKLFDDDRNNILIIYYPQGKSQIIPDMNANRRSLTDLIAVIDEIEASADSRVTNIVIGGFASPEGGFEMNDRLAWNRAVAVKEYIMQRSALKSSSISIYNGSSDWRGLRMLVEQSEMPMKQQVLDIIDNTPVWDSKAQKGRLGELMRLDNGRPYRYMYEFFFPKLRNAAYIKVYFENK